jgi:hypothetical protein
MNVEESRPGLWLLIGTVETAGVLPVMERVYSGLLTTLK